MRGPVDSAQNICCQSAQRCEGMRGPVESALNICCQSDQLLRVTTQLEYLAGQPSRKALAGQLSKIAPGMLRPQT